jgi:phospholipase/lecithinase/hemolysin
VAERLADDTGIYGRVDSDACTTTGSITSTTVAIPITTTSGQLKWDNTAGLWTGGVDFNVGGERITVTSITNGAGQTQTLNATVRGVNGYASSHASGVSVSLWDPAVVGL